MASAAQKKTARTNGNHRHNSEVVSPEFRTETRRMAMMLGKELRKRGVPSSTLAQLMNVTRARAEQMTNGKFAISAYRVATIAKLLGYKVKLELVRG